LLMKDPLLLHDLGFQLSFAATAGLLLWSHRVWAVLAGWHKSLAGRLGASLAVTLVPQLSTLPITWAAFGELALWGLPANLLVTPALGLVVPLAALHAILAALPGLGWLEWISRAALLPPLHYIWAILRAVRGLPGSLVQLPPLPPWGLLLLLAVAARLMMIPSGSYRPPFSHLRPSRKLQAVVIRGATAFLAVFSLGVSGADLFRSSHLLHVYFFDVGQGDAALLLPPDGRGILVDSGPASAAERLVAAIQRVTGGRGLDTVFLSHAHSDHVGGVSTILANLQPKLVCYGPGMEAHSELQLAGVQVEELVAASSLQLSGGLAVEVLWPGQDAAGLTENNRSLVLLFTYGRVGFLFPGDLEIYGQRALSGGSLAPGFGEWEKRGGLRVLKVPHHGGRTANWTPFYRQVWHPDVAVISVGRNGFGHPDRDLVASLAAGSLVARTDILGAIHLATDGRRLTVEGWVRDAVGLRRPRKVCVWDSEKRSAREMVRVNEGMTGAWR